MAPVLNGTSGNATSSTNVVYGQQPDDRNKTPRHPRWTRRETMVLIDGKKIAEERGRRGRRSSSVFGSDQLEPKWDSVSSHCRRHGVDRGPVQCRKRWSNLVSDFKKIKTWESQAKGEGESFWMLRSDLRREIKLPGYFDREVYDVLDGKAFTTAEYQLALVAVSPDENVGDGVDVVEVGDEDEMVEDEEARDGLFSEFEKVAQEENGTSPVSSPVPISEMKYQPFCQADSSQGAENKRKPSPHCWRGSEFQEGVKRRKKSSSDCPNINVGDLVVKALERNTNLLNAQFDDQKLNFQLDREQQKNQHDSLIAALNKVTDALEKIANKL